MEIYRHTLSKGFKNAVLGRQEMVQCKVFLTPNRNMFAGKFVNSERFWVLCGSILFTTSTELRFIK